jgi:selenocysteine lyase/cysteine desulfurase
MPDLWSEVRHEFPATARYAYLNAAAASPIPRPVRAAIEAFLDDMEQHGDLPWDAWFARRETVRAKVAQLVGAAPEEIAFVPNTSTGINVIADLLDRDGDILTDAVEFPTVTLPWLSRGHRMHFVAPRNGIVHAADFADAAPTAATMVLSHVQFWNGCRQDLQAFGAVKGHRQFVVSASQSAGAFPIDVRAARIDGLASAGHKWLCAGYGAGFLYVSRALLERPPRSIGWLSVQKPFLFDNRGYRLLPTAERHELGCPAFGSIVALGAAVELLSSLGIAAIAERVLALNTYLTDQLSARGVEILSPGGPHRSGATLCRAAAPARAVAFLRERGVIVTEKPEGVRISTHFYNNEEDIDRGVAALAAYVHREA